MNMFSRNITVVILRIEALARDTPHPHVKDCILTTRETLVSSTYHKTGVNLRNATRHVILGNDWCSIIKPFHSIRRDQ